MELGTAMLIMQVAGAAVAGAGSIMAAQQQAAAGQMQNQAAQVAAQSSQLQADQMRQRGEWEMAIARRNADEQKKKKEHLQGKMRAMQAASGFDPDSATDVQLGIEIEKEGTMRELFDVSMGQAAMNDMFFGAGMKDRQAAFQMWEGQNAEAMGKSQAMSTILGGVGGMFQKFGGAYSQYNTQQLQMKDASKWRTNDGGVTTTSSGGIGNWFYSSS